LDGGRDAIRLAQTSPEAANWSGRSCGLAYLSVSSDAGRGVHIPAEQRCFALGVGGIDVANVHRTLETLIHGQKGHHPETGQPTIDRVEDYSATDRFYSFALTVIRGIAIMSDAVSEELHASITVEEIGDSNYINWI
jgi:hypothetical protein